jgi:hypothetical protein
MPESGAGLVLMTSTGVPIEQFDRFRIGDIVDLD